MEVMEQIAAALTVPKPTAQELQRERRRQKNRDYYERKKHIWMFANQIQKLRALRDLLTEESHANH